MIEYYKNVVAKDKMPNILDDGGISLPSAFWQHKTAPVTSKNRTIDVMHITDWDDFQSKAYTWYLHLFRKL